GASCDFVPRPRTEDLRKEIDVRRIFLLCLAYALVSGPAGAADDDGHLRDAESILDKLEKGLMEEAPDSLTFGEKVEKAKMRARAKSAGTNPAETASVYEYKSTEPIKADSRVVDFQSLATLVKDLESEVDRLAADVQATKQRVVDEAGIDNFITIEAALGNADHAAIKNISVRLDGYDVYHV